MGTPGCRGSGPSCRLSQWHSSSSPVTGQDTDGLRTPDPTCRRKGPAVSPPSAPESVSLPAHSPGERTAWPPPRPSPGASGLRHCSEWAWSLSAAQGAPRAGGAGGPGGSHPTQPLGTREAASSRAHPGHRWAPSRPPSQPGAICTHDYVDSNPCSRCRHSSSRSWEGNLAEDTPGWRAFKEGTMWPAMAGPTRCQ